MRTNIVIDDELMAKALRVSRLPTKRAAVEAGLRLIIAVSGQGAIRSLKGKVPWEGDLMASRSSRVPDSAAR